jgi:hypothetical protein
MPILVHINGTQLCIDRNLAAHFWVGEGSPT